MTVKSTVRSAVRSAIRGTVRSGGALLPEWTPILDTLTTYFEYYTNFTPTGSNSTLEVVFYKQGSKIQTIAFGDASAFSIALDASDVLTFKLISNVELNGVPATSGVTAVPDGYYVLTGDLDITSDVKYYAANATPANFFGIQIHSIKNTDNDDPSNSIDINTVKRSKDAPLASDNLLINSLGSVGEELVVNGDFEDGLDGWSAPGGGWSAVGGRAYRAYSADFNQLQQQLSVTGSVQVEFDYEVISGTCRVDITNKGLAEFVGTGRAKVVIPGVQSGDYLRFARSTPSEYYIDNISARETTRNIGEIKNMVGYELVNRGE